MRRLHPEIHHAKRLADRYKVMPGDSGFRVWLLSDGCGWIILAERLATREAGEGFILGALQIEEPPSRLPVLAKPAHVSFRFDDDGYGWI